jgi:hypothetical protein
MEALYSVEFHNVCSPLNTVRVIKSKSTTHGVYEKCIKNPSRKAMRDWDVAGTIIIKWILKNFSRQSSLLLINPRYLRHKFLQVATESN